MKLHEPSPGFGTVRGNTGHRRNETFVATLISKMADPYALAFEYQLEGYFDVSQNFFQAVSVTRSIRTLCQETLHEIRTATKRPARTTPVVSSTAENRNLNTSDGSEKSFG